MNINNVPLADERVINFVELTYFGNHVVFRSNLNITESKIVIKTCCEHLFLLSILLVLYNRNIHEIISCTSV